MTVPWREIQIILEIEESHCKHTSGGRGAHSGESDFVTRLFVLVPGLLACFHCFSHLGLKCFEKEPVLTS